MTAPSGANVTLERGGYRATVVEVGAGIRTLTRDGDDLVVGYRLDEMCSGGRGQVLLPWPNRIADGRYHFGGRDHQLPLSEAVAHNAIHGLTRWVSWQLVDQTASTARWRYDLHPRPGYPGTLELTVDYQVSATAGLRVETSATNVGAGPAPYGAGAHPYLTVGRAIDGCQLRLPAAVRCQSDDRGLPGTPEPVDATGFDFRSPTIIGNVAFDDAFGGLTYDDGRATAELRDPDTGRSVTIWLSDAYRWLQVFSGERQSAALARQAMAIEPMTCPANAFVSGVDLVVLEPGETHRATFGIS